MARKASQPTVRRASPLATFDHLAQSSAQHSADKPIAEQVCRAARALSDHVRNGHVPTPDETVSVLQDVALIIFNHPNHPGVVSECVRLCGLLFLLDPNVENRKKQLLLHEFAAPTDLVYLVHLAFQPDVRAHNRRYTTSVLWVLARMIKRKYTETSMPSVFRDSLDYIAGTLEYYAILPDEIDRSHTDFLPDSFLVDLESRMRYYPALSRPPVAMTTP